MAWRKPLLALFVALLALAACEVGHRLWLRARGRPYGAAEAREELAALVDFARGFDAEPRAPGGRRAFHPYTGAHVLHPYFGFDSPDAGAQLAADLESAGRSPQELRILVVGGSVAATFQHLGEERLGELLLADPRLQGRNIHLLKYARSSFKHPQQLFTVAYLLGLGLEPDVVIGIDGFNEVAIGNYNATRGMHPTYPAYDKWLTFAAGDAADPELAELEFRLRARREELLQRAERLQGSLFLSSSLLGRSFLGRLHGLREEIARDQAEYLARLQRRGLPAHLYGPPFKGKGSRPLELIARHWLETSTSIHALCSARSIPYLHVLQPALHDEGSKPLTPEEIADADVDESWVSGVREGYPMLRKAAGELRARGVHFLDASGLFSGVEERIYRDACHFGERGNELLAQAIAGALLEIFPAR